MNTREMVDSGIEWIGKVPNYWKVSRIGDNFLIGAGISAPLDAKIFDASLLPFVRVSDLSRQDSKFITNTRDGVPFKYKNYIRKEGTIVFPKSGESIRSGIRKMLSSPCVVVSHLACMQAKRTLEKTFALWLMEPINFEEQINQTALPALNLSQISRKEIPLPSLSEQQSIANFLDHHVNLIDREANLIDKKIELLNDKRKALIFECVTGKRTVVSKSSLADTQNVVGHGDLVAMPTNKEHMIDSGVEWIGDVPKDWKIKRLKDAGTWKTGKNPINQEIGDIPVYGSSSESFSSTMNFLDIGPAIAIGRKGTIDKPFEIKGPFWAVDTCMYNKIESGIAYFDFVKYFMHVVPWVENSTKTALPSLTQTQVSNIPLVIPNFILQKEIGNFLNNETNLINKEISLLKRKKGLLIEKRKALIFEAVTGKIDCRSWTA